MSDSSEEPVVGSTTGAGAPAASDRNSSTIGTNGPILLHDVHFVEQMAHFDREKVPERQPHATGSGAFGTFEATADVSPYTKAPLFEKGCSAEMLARFSTVACEVGNPDTWRDVRGFSLKFYTEQGNYDLVGNNTPVFFVRDPIKFHHFIRSQKRQPDSGVRENHMQWDFWTSNRDPAHQVTHLMGERGLPRTWCQMNGYGSHTYMSVNAAGEKFWIEYHFHSNQGMAFFSNALYVDSRTIEKLYPVEARLPAEVGLTCISTSKVYLKVLTNSKKGGKHDLERVSMSCPSIATVFFVPPRICAVGIAGSCSPQLTVMSRIGKPNLDRLSA